MDESDAALVALVLRRLSEALGPVPEPDVALVRRWPLSLPQYAVGHLDRMAKLSELTSKFPALHLIGNAYHGVGLPDLIRQGREAARRIARS
jgi:oxygen-dependent protoporphyrinogen oxidase